MSATNPTRDLSCPSDELLAARAAGDLDETERSRMDQHLAACETCRVVLTELVRTTGSRPAAPRLGRYVLEEILGSGGMGTVWSAWDPELDRRVAVKLLHEARASDEARAQRFLAERQILAALVHPYIARLLDGGATPEGRAWFAMELIEGHPIDVWCRVRRLTVRQRVELMLPVCAAVSHAHAHLVVHRDLKPTNILVTHEGTPKLVDFGIAKLLLDGGGLTQTGLVPMTPAFAAPEQVRNEPVTTASDVYSLGVVLYELLAGKSPYGAARGDALLAAVRDAEPSPPSQAAADRRDARDLEGDLDAIVLMALRKDSKDRYASAQALADDLTAALEGRVTAARRGNRLYRAAKVVRRHRPAFAAATAAVLALIAGLVATLWQARAAAQERDLAERRFADVRALAHSVVFDYHDGIADLPGSTPLREQLVKDALKYLHSLEPSARGDVGLQVELAQALLKIGDVQGDPYGSSLGHIAEARASYLEAQTNAYAALRSSPGNPDALRALAVSYEKLGALVEVEGKLQEAVAAYQAARAIYEQLLARKPGDSDVEYAMALQDVASGQVNTHRGNLDEAQAQLERAVAVRERVAKRTNDPEHRCGLAAAQISLGEVMEERMNIDRAYALFEKSLSEFEVLVREVPTSVRFQRGLGVAQTWMSRLLVRLNRPQEGLELARDLVARIEPTLAADPKNAVARRDVAVGLSLAAEMYQATKQPKEAVRFFERSLEVITPLLADDPDNAQVKYDRAVSLSNLARARAEAGLTDAAEKACREALDLFLTLPADGADDKERVADGWVCFARLYAETRPADALEPLKKARELIAEVRKLSPSNRIAALAAELWLLEGECLRRLKRSTEARDAFANAAAELDALARQGPLVGPSVEHLQKAVAGRAE